MSLFTTKNNAGILELVNGSITDYKADALVCPANPALGMVAMKGGVQYAFLCDGGASIFKEAEAIGERAGPAGMAEASAHITGAGALPAKYIIHSVAVGERRGHGYCDKALIARSVRNVLNLARERDLRSVGFPALGTGLWSVPLEDAVQATADEVAKEYERPTSIQRVGLLLYAPSDYSKSEKLMSARPDFVRVRSA